MLDDMDKSYIRILCRVIGIYVVIYRFVIFDYYVWCIGLLCMIINVMFFSIFMIRLGI